MCNQKREKFRFGGAKFTDSILEEDLREDSPDSIYANLTVPKMLADVFWVMLHSLTHQAEQILEFNCFSS